MTAAVVALAVALAAAVAGLLALALKALDAERRCGDARSDESALAVRLESMTAQRDTESARADREKERADALDDAIADLSVDLAGPVDGSVSRLLSFWTARQKRRDGAVPATAAAPDRSGDLLRPGE